MIPIGHRVIKTTVTHAMGVESGGGDFAKQLAGGDGVVAGVTSRTDAEDLLNPVGKTDVPRFITDAHDCLRLKSKRIRFIYVKHPITMSRPQGFKPPVTVVVPARRLHKDERPTRGGTDFGALDEVTFTLSVDTRANQYLDLSSLSLEFEKLTATTGAVTDRTALVKGGPQNLIRRLRIKFNDTTILDLDAYARLYNLVRQWGMGRQARREAEFQGWREGNAFAWDGEDIKTTPFENIGPLRLITMFSPTTKYIPTRLLEGANIDVEITFEDNEKVVVKKVRNDDELATMADPKYSISGPKLSYDLVSVNMETQAALESEMAQTGGLAFNYVHPHYFTRVLESTSTFDHIQFTTLSRNFAGIIMYMTPIFNSLPEFHTDSPLEARLDNSVAMSSGFDLCKDQYFQSIPLPMYGDGSYQFVVGDRRVPPTPRQWTTPLKTVEFPIAPATAAGSFPATSYDDTTRVQDTPRSADNQFPDQAYHAKNSMMRMVDPLMQMFDAIPMWPESSQAYYRSQRESEPYSGKNPTRVIPSVSSFYENSGHTHTSSFDWKSHFLMTEYTSAYTPTTGAVIQSGTDVDRSGGNFEIWLKRASFESATQVYPRQYAHFHTLTTADSHAGVHVQRTGLTGKPYTSPTGDVDFSQTDRVAVGAVVSIAVPTAGTFKADPYVRTMRLVKGTNWTNVTNADFYVGNTVSIKDGTTYYSGVIIAADSLLSQGSDHATAATVNLDCTVRFSLPPPVSVTSSGEFEMRFQYQRQPPRSADTDQEYYATAVALTTIDPLSW